METSQTLQDLAIYQVPFWGSAELVRRKHGAKMMERFNGGFSAFEESPGSNKAGTMYQEHG